MLLPQQTRDMNELQAPIAHRGNTPKAAVKRLIVNEVCTCVLMLSSHYYSSSTSAPADVDSKVEEGKREKRYVTRHSLEMWVCVENVRLSSFFRGKDKRTFRIGCDVARVCYVMCGGGGRADQVCLEAVFTAYPRP